MCATLRNPQSFPLSPPRPLKAHLSPQLDVVKGGLEEAALARGVSGIRRGETARPRGLLSISTSTKFPSLSSRREWVEQTNPVRCCGTRALSPLYETVIECSPNTARQQGAGQKPSKLKDQAGPRRHDASRTAVEQVMLGRQRGAAESAGGARVSQPQRTCKVASSCRFAARRSGETGSAPSRRRAAAAAATGESSRRRSTNSCSRLSLVPG